MCSLRESEEIFNITVRKLGFKKVLKDNLIGSIAERYFVKVVMFHKAIEDVGTENKCFGYLNRHARKLVKLGMYFDNMVEKGKTTPLSTQRTVADTGEMGILVKLTAVENSHYTNVLHSAILYNCVKNNLTMSIDILQPVPRNMLEKIAYREDGTGAKPAAHVVTRDMIKHGIAWDSENIILQFFQRTHSKNLLMRLRIAENKVTEAHMLLH